MKKKNTGLQDVASKLNELLSSKIILEHHLAFGNDCGSKNIYPPPGLALCGIQSR